MYVRIFLETENVQEKNGNIFQREKPRFLRIGTRNKVKGLFFENFKKIFIEFNILFSFMI